MFLMYVDESGDCGLVKSPSNLFCLSGIVIHELRWQTYLDQLIAFRKMVSAKYGLHLREEIHAAHFITNPGKIARIKRNDRLSIIRLFANELATMPDLNVINVVVNKSSKPAGYNVFENAWGSLFQRFENTISRRNFRGPLNADERGIIIPDNTDSKKLTRLLRKLKRYNPIPNQSQYGAGYRNLALRNVIEDPYYKNSSESLFIQAADLIAFLLYQSRSPNIYMKTTAGYKYFNRLEPILCKFASSRNPFGIVEL